MLTTNPNQFIENTMVIIPNIRAETAARCWGEEAGSLTLMEGGRAGFCLCRLERHGGDADHTMTHPAALEQALARAAVWPCRTDRNLKAGVKKSFFAQIETQMIF